MAWKGLPIGLALAVLVALPAAYSKPVLTVTCDEPEGLRFDYGEINLAGDPPPPEIKLSRDGFKGVNPTFLLNDTAPDILTVIFGDSIPIDNDLLRERDA